MAVFGRDSIISAIQTKLLGPELLAGTLHTLADLQATQRDDFRDAQPGKIPHEVRQGSYLSWKRSLTGATMAAWMPRPCS